MSAQIQRIATAMEHALSAPAAVLSSESRLQYVVYCRMVFAHVCQTVARATNEAIAKKLKVSERTVRYYQLQFRQEQSRNAELRAMYSKVIMYLKDNPAKKIKTEDKTQNERFARDLETQLGTPVKMEVRFHPTRRWRFDFAIPALKIAIEKEGGTWVSGRHNRATGFFADMEKYNNATALGWRLIRATPQNLESPETLQLIQQVVSVVKNPPEA